VPVLIRGRITGKSNESKFKSNKNVIASLILVNAEERTRDLEEKWKNKGNR